ncbi:SUMF1/EgtB/PvdO family nonheme iron enzyme [Azospirillum sp. RWY-5-1]|uniref:SUMF1/EgtB/PvdO family nonheme iron enzyme n=1 Tax=Azospirillum oleiclasticum TaxID=2735135 RepID=A0ABX2TN27_9PROT|nr:bifunctional serine/threonine-protein kinase/formylglycine-generating enzyme family protein [Azospirillum oleiclasticum]NYZ17895.1 SUMF1/EgtB/PvdO family nonheme iron enzyme [Azospirillum oleiclasticum]NYZ25103.1 SUMF1/EgtB/PvdO family nonheme iron enzyme [Azospirillum oleiclasticum]
MVDVRKLSGSRIGSYHLGTLLGFGTFGAVYRADVVVGDRVIAKPVAVKVLDPAGLDRTSPLRELENATELRHPHLVEVIGHPGEAELRDAEGDSGRVFWFAMELATETLLSRLTRGALDEAETRTLLRQIGAALAWLHERKLVHRDVKPANILKVGDVWKLGDLGLTRQAVEGYYAQLKGTTLYLSPESFDDAAPKACWDMWALGMAALEAVTGGHPWRHLTERKLYTLVCSEEPLPLPKLPKGVEAAVRGCLDKEPGRRWTAQRLADGTNAGGATSNGTGGAKPHASPSARLAPDLPWRVHSGAWRHPGCVFQDAEVAPRMVVLPRGEFWMGSKKDELERFADESPCHKVRIGYDLALGECAVSFSEWDAYADDGNFRPGDEGWGRDDRPIINVSWLDVKRYIDWLNSRLRLTDRPDRYRLPSEAEWEYGCRGGTDTPFWWGLEITPDQANYDGKCVYAGGGLREIYRQQTVPVRSFSPNPYGLYQVHGNVLEWCEDVWHRSYVGAPTDGSAWVVGGDQDLRILRGGSWHSHPAVLRSAFRIGSAPFSTSSIHGFRIARTLSS